MFSFRFELYDTFSITTSERVQQLLRTCRALLGGSILAIQTFSSSSSQLDSCDTVNEALAERVIPNRPALLASSLSNLDFK